MSHYILVLWLLQALSLVLVSEAVPKVPAIIVFGDSSVDAGNNNFIPTIARSNFQPYGRDFEGGKATGRFSNGRIPTDFISEAFGIKPSIPAYLDPAYNISDFATGVTFASAGSGYDNATSDVLSVIPLWQELEYYKEYQRKLSGYLGPAKANDTIAESLHLISLGTNDFLENYYNRPNRRAEYSIEQYQEFLVGIATNFVRSLYALGARKISLGGVPPMGCLPLERTTNVRNGNDCRDDYNTVARQFNGKLNDSVANNLTKDLPGAHIVFSSSYDIFMSIVKNPTDYGFESAAVGCCSTGLFEMGYACNANIERTCTDASKFVFWDAFHPSEKTSHIIADYLVKNDLSVFTKVGDITRHNDDEQGSWQGHGGVKTESWMISIFVLFICFIIY